MDLASLIAEASELLTRRETLIERIEDMGFRTEVLQEQADEAASNLAAEVEARDALDDTLESLRDSIVEHHDGRSGDVVEIATRLDEALRYREEEPEMGETYEGD